MKDNIWWLLLLVAGALMIDNAFAGEWNDKPVMCEQKEIFEKTMVERGEIIFSKGDMLAKVRTKDGLSDIPAVLDLRIYINPQKQTFTIAEFHKDYNSVCVLAYGENYTTLGISS
tara:strand:- start:9 stop:353 length:345 start_codon:yes stop_codon:yes gene_type:complete